MTEEKSKHQLLVELAAFIVAIDIAGDGGNAELLRVLQRKAKKALKARGGGNPNLAEARSKGHATNRAKATGTYRRIEPALKELAAAGVVTYADFAAGLNEKGILSPKGGKWFAASVRRVMTGSH